MEQEVFHDISTPRCSKCGSTQVRTRLTTNQLVCITCGYVTPIKKLGEEN